jgi:hypothetical protein
MASGNTLAIFMPLMADAPIAANPATQELRNGHPILAFDSATQEYAIWSYVMPQHYAGGNITALLEWTAVPTTGNVGWGITLERVLAGTLDIDADSFATEQIVTAATVPGTSGIPTVSSVTATAGATGTDSVAAGDLFRLRVRRDVATDTAAGDGQLASVELREA